jgi:glycosyltransferase involved in cell wall biosynthesis
MATGISVIVCCFNSAARIAPTLQHLTAQTGITVDLWEVIVVDNGSTDNTADVATRVWNSVEGDKPTFKVVPELTPGLSSARQKGIEEAKFDYVLFCDDDNWLEDRYVSEALSIMQSSPNIGALGGKGTPVFEEMEPPYFWVNQYNLLAVGAQSAIEGDITEGRGVLYGAGMILNKLAFKDLQNNYKFQFLLSDRIGKSLASSGDHEICLALRKIGYKIFYSEKLKFEHFIPGSRTTIGYYKKLFLGFGASYALLHVYRLNRNNLYSLKNDYRYICFRCVKNIADTSLRLVAKGYFFTSNKYKYIDVLHALYRDIGILKTFTKVKNLYKKQFSNNSLFNTTT